MLNRFSRSSFSFEVEQVRHQQFMREAKPHLIGGIITGCFVYFLFREFTHPLGTLIWFSCQLCLASFSFALYQRYKRKQAELNGRHWSYVVFTMSLLWGGVWSLPPYLFLDMSSIEYLATLMLIITAMTISPAPAMAIYPYAYSVFLTLPLLAMGLQLWHSSINNWLVLCIPFFWLATLIYGWQLHQTLTNAIRLRIDLEQARNEAETANQAKSNFLAAASHDLRQPLQAIDLFLEVLKQRFNIDNNDDIVCKLESSIDNLSELLNALLDVSKLDAGVIETQNCHIKTLAALEKTILQYQAIAQTKPFEFTQHLQDETLYVDPLILDRIVHNLLSNAFRYTQQGSVQLSSFIEGPHLVLAISDTGIGIASEEQNRIFDEFHQLDNPERDKQKGIGLGLAIVKRLAALQNWKITLESELGAGSCFSIYLPLGDAKKIKALSSPPKREGQFAHNKVLLIDDDAAVRESLSKLLHHWGCDIHAFSSLAQAQAAIEQTDLRDWQPELIISDFRLQAQQNGIQAIHTLQDYYQTHSKEPIPGLLITGDTAPSRLQQAYDSDLQVLYKPVKPAQLRQVLHKHFAA